MNITRNMMKAMIREAYAEGWAASRIAKPQDAPMHEMWDESTAKKVCVNIEKSCANISGTHPVEPDIHV